MRTNTLLEGLASLEPQVRFKAMGTLWEELESEIDERVFGRLKTHLRLSGAQTRSDVKGEVYLRAVSRVKKNPWNINDLNHLFATLRLMRDQVLYDLSDSGNSNVDGFPVQDLAQKGTSPSSRVAAEEGRARELKRLEELRAAMSDEQQWLYSQYQIEGKSWKDIAAEDLLQEGHRSWSPQDLDRRVNTLQHRWKRLLERLRTTLDQTS